MALFGAGSFAYSGLLAFLLLGLASGQDPGENASRAEPCQCAVFSQDDPIHIYCAAINTTEAVECAAGFIKNVPSRVPGSNLSIHLDSSNVDLFPGDFFASYSVTKLFFWNCNASKSPSRLIGPICSSLIEIHFQGAVFAVIPASGFKGCVKLRELTIANGNVRKVSPKAFVGLPSLKALNLRNNSLQRFDGYEGVESLQALILDFNKINQIGPDAFRGMGQLEFLSLSSNNVTNIADGTFDPLKRDNGSVYVRLDGNPFICKCSSQWFQEWIDKQPPSISWTRDNTTGLRDGCTPRMTIPALCTPTLSQNQSSSLSTTPETVPPGPSPAAKAPKVKSPTSSPARAPKAQPSSSSLPTAPTSLQTVFILGLSLNIIMSV